MIYTSNNADGINWTKYRKGIVAQMLSLAYAENREEAYFMADLLVMVAKTQDDKGVNWEHIESLIQKVIGTDGFMANVGY